jgi:hypothetical protein
MLTRWIIRLVAIVAVLLMGAFADAQQPTGGGRSTPSSGGGGGAGSVRSGGGNGDGPTRAPSSASGGNKGTSSSNGGNQGGTGNAGGTGGESPTPPKKPGTGTGSVITKTGPGSTSTGTPITGTGTPITQTPPTGNPNPTIGKIQPPRQDRREGFRGERRDETRGDQGEQHHRRHRDPSDPNRFRNAPTFIVPQTYGWAPYTWWFNGTNNWFPTAWDDGYDGNDNYVERDEDRYDRVAPTTPTVPTPAQDQAQSTNALQGMPAYSQALVEFKAAQQTYEDASARVLAKLRKDPEYRRLLAQRDRAEDRVEAVQAGAKIPPSVEQVTPAARHKLEVSSKVTKMEQDAIAADPEAAAAKAKMVEANARLSALRKQAEAGGGRAQ